MEKFTDIIKNEVEKAMNGEEPDLENFVLEMHFDDVRYNIKKALYVVNREILHNCNTQELLKDTLTLMKPALEKMCVENEMNAHRDELLYSATAIVGGEMKHPEFKTLPVFDEKTSVIEIYISTLYNLDFMYESFIFRWYEDADDETPGKLDVILHVTPLMNWLKMDDVLSDSEDEDEDDA